MADGSEGKSKDQAGAESLPQHEIDAQPRARKSRASESCGWPGAGIGRPRRSTPAKHIAAKKTSAKSAEKARPLSEWLDAQEQDGRRN